MTTTFGADTPGIWDAVAEERRAVWEANPVRQINHKLELLASPDRRDETQTKEARRGHTTQDNR